MTISIALYVSYLTMSNPAHKVVVVGASGTGKTAIVQRLIDNTFIEDGTSTVGVEFKPFTVTTDSGVVKLGIWDTAGQERFRSVAKAYFRGAVGGVLVFAVDDLASFHSVDEWLADIRKLSTPNAMVILVGNKIDCEETRAVTQEDANEFANRHNLVYLETSARSGDGISEAFIRLAKGIEEKTARGELERPVESVKAPPIIHASKPSDKRDCAC